MKVVGWILYFITIGLDLYYLFYVITTFIATSKTNVEKEQHVNLLSIIIFQTILLVPITYIPTAGILSRSHLLWMLPFWLISHQMAMAAHKVLCQRRIIAVFSSLIVAIIAGSLIVLQFYLAGENGLWTFVRVGSIPIPILGITFVISSIAAFVGIHMFIVALIYFPLRKVYGID